MTAIQITNATNANGGTRLMAFFDVYALPSDPDRALVLGGAARVRVERDFFPALMCARSVQMHRAVLGR